MRARVCVYVCWVVVVVGGWVGGRVFFFFFFGGGGGGGFFKHCWKSSRGPGIGTFVEGTTTNHVPLETLLLRKKRAGYATVDTLIMVNSVSLVRAMFVSCFLPTQVVHPIDKTSPLYGLTPEQLAAKRCEIIVVFDAISEGCSDSLQVCTLVCVCLCRFARSWAVSPFACIVASPPPPLPPSLPPFSFAVLHVVVSLARYRQIDPQP